MKLSERNEGTGGPLGSDQFHFIRGDGGSPEAFASYRGRLDEIPGLSAAYDFGIPYYDGTPTASEIVARIPIARNITIPAGFAGAVGYNLAANPSATFDIDVQDDGVSIGTVSISTGGTYTFSTDGGTAKSITGGSLLTFVAPATPDATIDGFQFIIQATQD